MKMIVFAAAMAAFLAFGCAQQYRCRNPYSPINYRRNSILPTTCNASMIPATCPRSWKSGVSRGQSTDLPLIDTQFISCHEGLAQCGYVPLDASTGQVAGNSGVRIATRVDLGSKDRNYFTSRSGIDYTLLNKLEPFLNLTGSDAACAVLERPLLVTSSEANQLNSFTMNELAATIEQRYQSSSRSRNEVSFRSLPRGIRTAIIDVWFQLGAPEAYPNFWNFVIRNDWTGAVRELRNFYSNPGQQSQSDLKRRNDEADIIEAANATCERSVDAVFLLDESGSVGATDFTRSKNFVRTLINAFPDNKIGDTDGSRFGLAAFSSSYRSIFSLSTYSTKAGYLAAVDRVIKRGGGTNLGFALTSVQSQFTESRGARPEEDGLPRILVVLTDGRSSDSVLAPSRILHNDNIVIYAIGIGNYDSTQLNQIASSSSHVILLASFTDLADFTATLTASTCNEPQPVSLERKISGSVQKDTFQYYKFQLSLNQHDRNLRVELNDLAGSTLFYASRDNPHPYKYDNTFGFDSSTSSRKTIVIAPDRSQNSEPKFIYISVTAVTDSASFTVEAVICDPEVCQEGISNDSQSLQQISLVTLFMTALMITGTIIL